MPQAANISVNNASAVAKVFTLMTPSAGDGGLAIWNLKEGAAPVAFPVFSASAKKTSNNSRKTVLKFNMPYSYVDTASGLVKRGPAFEVNVDASIPYDFPEAMRADAVAYTTNLIASTLVKELIRDGYPAV